jgi:hypothetical protein
MDAGTIIVVAGVTLIALMIADQNKRILEMLDFSRLEAAFDSLAASVDSVANAIRNPQVDNNSQAAIDAMAGRLEAVSEGLHGLADEENAMDTADAVAESPPESEPIEPEAEGAEPAPEPTPPTGEGTDGNA